MSILAKFALEMKKDWLFASLYDFGVYESILYFLVLFFIGLFLSSGRAPLKCCFDSEITISFLYFTNLVSFNLKIKKRNKFINVPVAQLQYFVLYCSKNILNNKAIIIYYITIE